MKPELVEIIGKEHTLRVLFALRASGPQRFGALEQALGVNPAQLDRALKWLHARLYVLATSVPQPRGPIAVTYDLSRRGAAFLDAFDAFVAGAHAQRHVLGEKLVRDIEALAG